VSVTTAIGSYLNVRRQLSDSTQERETKLGCGNGWRSRNSGSRPPVHTLLKEVATAPMYSHRDHIIDQLA